MTGLPFLALDITTKWKNTASGYLNERSRALSIFPSLDLIFITETQRTESSLTVMSECRSLLGGNTRWENNIRALLGDAVVFQSSPSSLELFAGHTSSVVSDRQCVSRQVGPHDFYPVSPGVIAVGNKLKNCHGRLVDDLPNVVMQEVRAKEKLCFLRWFCR